MSNPPPGPFQLNALPWDENALEPVISGRTIGFHYGKHHLAYVQKTNELVKGTRFAELPLERVVTLAHELPEHRKLFNQAAQAWNHDFFWHSLAPRAGGKPGGEVGKRIEADFGSYDEFRGRFVQSAVDCFGSGWVWLVERNGKLDIMATSNAENPLVLGATPLLTVDVWEHAYYLDYQSKRQDFVTAVVDRLLDWRLAERLLEESSQRRAA